MTQNQIIGAETPIDDLIREYFPETPNSMLYELFESDHAMLTAALLMEMRGERAEDDRDGAAEAVYSSLPNQDVTETEQSVSWGFSASTVVIWGFDENVDIAFKDTNKGDRRIPLTPSEAPFSLSPPGGLDASKVWYQTQGAVSTSLNVLALR